jgi:hypothetical protein
MKDDARRGTHSCGPEVRAPKRGTHLCGPEARAPRRGTHSCGPEARVPRRGTYSSGPEARAPRQGTHSSGAEARAPRRGTHPGGAAARVPALSIDIPAYPCPIPNLSGGFLDHPNGVLLRRAPILLRLSRETDRRPALSSRRLIFRYYCKHRERDRRLSCRTLKSFFLSE